VAEVLSEEAIRAAVADLPGWQREGNEIRKRFQFKDFRHAMEFVNRVADEAESAQHHPDIDIRYNTVTMALSTHSAGGLTRKDMHLAGRIDAAQTPTL